MYLSHFGLQKTPFDSSPDPSVFYPSATHQEALRILLGGIESRAGFLWLSGRAGLGKTTVLRLVLERLDRERARVIFITDPDVSYRGLLEAIYTHLGSELPESPGLIDLGHHLYELLRTEYDRGRNVVLVIDDVQKMPVRTLACVRHLQNMEKEGRKLIQVILCGREPELSNILKLGRLRQLQQKMPHRATLAPLSREESMEYVRFRVSSVAGAKRFPFTQTALKQIAEHCGGIPSHLNLFCERALEAGWRREENPVGATTVKDVVAGLLSVDCKNEKASSRSSVGIAVMLMAILWLFTLGLTLFREGRTVGGPQTGETIATAPPFHDGDASGGRAQGPAGKIERHSPSGQMAPTASVRTDPARSRAGAAGQLPKVGLPRIDRLPGEPGSQAFWVYGPRDLPRSDGAP